jgi:hypothetical protein
MTLQGVAMWHSAQSLHIIIERVADGHASISINHNTSHGMIELTVAAALPAYNPHVRTNSVS